MKIDYEIFFRTECQGEHFHIEYNGGFINELVILPAGKLFTQFFGDYVGHNGSCVSYFLRFLLSILVHDYFGSYFQLYILYVCFILFISSHLIIHVLVFFTTFLNKTYA